MNEQCFKPELSPCPAFCPTQLDSDGEVQFPAINLKHNPDRIDLPTNLPDKNLSPGDPKETKSRESKSHDSTPKEWYDDILSTDGESKAEDSGKFLFLLALLREAEALKEKVLVFTQSLLTLDLIEELLSRPENGEWTPGLDYYRLDGSTRSEMRTHQMSDFNEQDNDR